MRKNAKKILTAERIIRTLEEHKDEIRKRSVKKIGLFGSFSKKKQRSKSDLDFLVEFVDTTFDNYMELKFFLERTFHRRVDLVTEKGLKQALQGVKKEVIYAKRI